MTRDETLRAHGEIPAGTWDTMAVVGRVARPHGLRGEVVIDPETDFPETRFAPGARLALGAEDGANTVVVRCYRVHKGRPLVGFEGIETVEAAGPLAGRELRVPAESLAPLPDGVYYRHDLVGCRVTTTGGTAVGDVTRVETQGGGTRLVIEGDRGEILVPFAEAICVELDLAARRIVIDPPEGLLELNVVTRRQRRTR